LNKGGSLNKMTKTAQIFIILLAITLYLSAAQTPQVFTADIVLSSPEIKGNGVIKGTINYDNSRNAYSTILKQYTVLYLFNAKKGEDGRVAEEQFAGQNRVRTGPGCKKCESSSLRNSMPKFFMNSTVYRVGTLPNQAAVAGCTAYVPNAPFGTMSKVQQIWFNPQGYVCKVLFSDQSSFAFSGWRALPSTISFELPTGCICSKPMDISLVLDRSGSISFTDFAKMSNFLKGFGDSFTWGTDATNLAIVNFNTVAFSTYNAATKKYNAPPVLSMTGNSDAVLQSLKGLNCCNANPPAGVNPSSVSCCDGWTSISAGLIAGANELAKSVRKEATKVIVLLTDGKTNTPVGKEGGSCYIAPTAQEDCCRYAVGSGCPDYVYKPGSVFPGAQYLYCIGDRNYNTIVDDWETNLADKLPNWSCTGSGSGTSCDPARNSCNGTLCNPNIAKNKMLACHTDLINAREYGFKYVGPDTRFYAIGVGEISRTELEIVIDARYRRPEGRAPEHPITWTPVYNAADTSKADMSRIISVDNFSKLASILSLLTSTICGEEVSCQCCSICMCGQCLSPDECPTTDPCRDGYVASGCCATKPHECPPRNCETTTCVANTGCTYAPLDPCDRTEPECFNYACGPQNSCVKSPKFQPPSNACKISGCIGGKLVNNEDKTCPFVNLCVENNCDPSSGLCIQTPLPLPISDDKCKVYVCDPNETVPGKQFKLVVANDCPFIDNCNPNECNPASGICVRTTITCNDPNNLCDITPCDPSRQAGDVCPPQVLKTCSPIDTNNKCRVNGTCEPKTGQCVYNDIQCFPDDCRAKQCEKETGDCVYLQPDATCDGICANVLNCPSNKCFVSQCDPKSTSFKENCDTVIDYSDRCTMPTDDFCVQSVYCDNTTGCVYVQKESCPVLEDKCLNNTRNSSDPRCCVPVPKDCDLGDPCFLYSCDSNTGECLAEPKCPVGRTTCHEYSCLNGECIDKPTLCPYKVCIKNTTCDEVLGCKEEPIDCDDGDLCTDDYCENDVCVHIRTCNNCTLRTSGENGTIIETPIMCDDDNNCTRDYCDDHLGCVFEPYFPEFCDDRDNCTTDSCPVEVGTCVNFYNHTCETNETCYTARCLSPSGQCVLSEIICALDKDGNPYVKVNESDSTYAVVGDCSFAFCSNDTCAISIVPCPIFDELTPGEVVGLSIGVIVGVAIAVAAVLFLAGGGAYAIATGTGVSSTSTVSNNPLYKDKGGERTNPLHDPTG